MSYSMTQYSNYINEILDDIPLKDNPKYGLKFWRNKDNLQKKGSISSCGEVNSPIAGKNGTFKNPAALYMGFKFNFPTGTVVEKIIVHYTHQTVSLNSSQAADTFPTFAGPKISLYNANIQHNKYSIEPQRGHAPTSTATHDTVTFTNVPLTEINWHDFGIIIDYPANTSTNTGLINLSDVYLEMVLSNANIVVDASTTSTKVSKGASFDVTFSVSQKDTVYYNPSLSIILSDGLSYKSTVIENGKLLTTDGLTWNPTLNQSREATTTLKFNAEKTGKQTVTILDKGLEISKSLTITVTDQEITIDTNPVDSDESLTVKMDELKSYLIEGKTEDKNLTQIPLDIHLPASCEIENINSLANNFLNVSQETKDNELILHITPYIDSKGLFSIPLAVRFNDSGVYRQVVYSGDKILESRTIIVRPSTYDTLGFTRVKIPEETTDAMGNHWHYNAISMVRYIANTKSKYEVQDLGKNLKFGVYNASEDYVNDETEFLKRVQFSKNMDGINYTKFKVYFEYNENNPLYFVWTHEYTQSENYNIFDVEFLEPLLFQRDYPTDFEDPALYPTLTKYLLQSDKYANVTLPAHKQTNPVVIYDWSDDGGVIDLEDIIIQGIQVEWNYIVEDDVETQLQIKTYTSDEDGNNIINRGYRNITLHKGSGTKAIGDAWDTFGLKPHDLRNINRMELELQLTNRGNNSIYVQLNGFKINLHYLSMNKQTYGFAVDGERSEEYGIFFKDFSWDFGTKNDVKYYQTSGTDNNTAYRSNIDKKDLTVEFEIGGCDLEESTMLLEKVAKLFTNDRTQYNKPIPKKIVFDHMPNYEFWFVREDPLDTTIKLSYYEVKVKLIIPSGTAETRATTVTGSIGNNMSLARTLPYITCLATGKGSIEVTERYTKQTMVVTNSKISEGDVIQIDSVNRKVYYHPKDSSTLTNITESVDWSSTWFSVMGEYVFDSTNCTVTEVEFKERW